MAVVVEDEQAISVVVGAKAAAAASRSARSTIPCSWSGYRRQEQTAAAMRRI
jgi:hypothetical protein